MSEEVDIDERLRQSAKMLRAWGWMTSLSSRPEEAVAVLTAEARALVILGTHHPKKVREIGRLIVAYERFITQIRSAMPPTPPNSVAEGDEEDTGRG